MALANMEFKRPKLVSFGKKEKREEEEKKRKKREEPRSSKPRYGTLVFCMETNLDHGIEWIYGTLRLFMIKSLSQNLGFC